ncbi:hypothetical protein B0H34DRAFT_738378 [Crassisporium funariophilum]|nr:hypothetical protein B0H34DRAFT_738378 [Crassisporium funariophilum]
MSSLSLSSRLRFLFRIISTDQRPVADGVDRIATNFEASERPDFDHATETDTGEGPISYSEVHSALLGRPLVDGCEATSIHGMEDNSGTLSLNSKTQDFDFPREYLKAKVGTDILLSLESVSVVLKHIRELDYLRQLLEDGSPPPEISLVEPDHDAQQLKVGQCIMVFSQKEHFMAQIIEISSKLGSPTNSSQPNPDHDNEAQTIATFNAEPPAISPMQVVHYYLIDVCPRKPLWDPSNMSPLEDFIPTEVSSAIAPSKSMFGSDSRDTLSPANLHTPRTTSPGSPPRSLPMSVPPLNPDHQIQSFTQTTSQKSNATETVASKERLTIEINLDNTNFDDDEQR